MAGGYGHEADEETKLVIGNLPSTFSSELIRALVSRLAAGGGDGEDVEDFRGDLLGVSSSSGDTRREREATAVFRTEKAARVVSSRINGFNLRAGNGPLVCKPGLPKKTNSPSLPTKERLPPADVPLAESSAGVSSQLCVSSSASPRPGSSSPPSSAAGSTSVRQRQDVHAISQVLDRLGIAVPASSLEKTVASWQNTGTSSTDYKSSRTDYNPARSNERDSEKGEEEEGDDDPFLGDTDYSLNCISLAVAAARHTHTHREAAKVNELLRLVDITHTSVAQTMTELLTNRRLLFRFLCFSPEPLGGSIFGPANGSKEVLRSGLCAPNLRNIMGRLYVINDIFFAAVSRRLPGPWRRKDIFDTVLLAFFASLRTALHRHFNRGFRDHKKLEVEGVMKEGVINEVLINEGVINEEAEMEAVDLRIRNVLYVWLDSGLFLPSFLQALYLSLSLPSTADFASCLSPSSAVPGSNEGHCDALPLPPSTLPSFLSKVPLSARSMTYGILVSKDRSQAVHMMGRRLGVYLKGSESTSTALARLIAAHIHHTHAPDRLRLRRDDLPIPPDVVPKKDRPSLFQGTTLGTGLASESGANSLSTKSAAIESSTNGEDTGSGVHSADGAGERRFRATAEPAEANLDSDDEDIFLLEDT